MRAKTHPHHFDFSHNAVPQLAFNDPEMLADNLGLDADGVFTGLWNYVGTLLEENKMQRLTDSITVSKRKLITGPDVWVVEMPKPQAEHESYFCAIAQQSKSKLWAFALDKGSGTSLIFKVYQKDKETVAHGFSGEPSISTFLMAIQEVMSAA